MENTQRQNIQIEADNLSLKGVYANNVIIAHSKEEFVLDFLMIHPPKGLLVNRTIVSPQHFKRMVKAFSDNLKKFEDANGSIPESRGPEAAEVGFKA